MKESSRGQRGKGWLHRRPTSWETRRTANHGVLMTSSPVTNPMILAYRQTPFFVTAARLITNNGPPSGIEDLQQTCVSSLATEATGDRPKTMHTTLASATAQEKTACHLSGPGTAPAARHLQKDASSQAP